jgi:tetratricopeptide (TPR) repeat protein
MTNIFFLLFLTQVPAPTFLDEAISSANEKISKEPARPEGYNDLAMALARKERETGNPELLTKAENAFTKSLKLQPANFEGRRARVAVRLRQKRYEDALEEAMALNKQTPDDNQMYGFLSEAQIGIGNYAEAEKAVQRMVDLRQVNGAGMERGAVIRELIGYPDAAIDWWNQALQLSSDRDTEERAFIHTQMARVYREQGKYDGAAQHARQALELCHDYPEALVQLAIVRMEQKQADEAIALIRIRLKIAPYLEARYLLGQALDIAGKTEQASVEYAMFEKQARAAVDLPRNANASLVRYLADHGKSSDAIAIAARSVKRRHDLFNERSYAWALLQNGRPAGAMVEIRNALAPGMRDPGLYFDAGLIARGANDLASAGQYLRTAFEINSNSPNAGEIMKLIASASQTGTN